MLIVSGCSDSGRPETLEQIRASQEANDFESTIEPLRELMRASPGDPELNYLYGRALVQTGHANLARWALRRAMEDPSHLAQAGSQLAFLSLSTRDFNEVIAITDQVLAQDPEYVPALLMRANAYAHWKNNPELAVETADRVLAIDPNAVEAYEPRILGLLDLDRFDEAKAALREAGEKVRAGGATPAVLAWHCSTTAAFEEEGGDLEATRAKWLECLEKFPSDPEVVSNAVGFYDSHGEPEHALEAIESAFEADPSRALRVSLANRLVYHGRTDEAEALLREATESDVVLESTAAWIDLANFQQARGDDVAAAESLGRAIEGAEALGAPDPSLRFQYAEALLLAGEIDRAAAAADELTVPAHRHVLRARIAQKRGDFASALDEFDQALTLWPNNEFARYYAALAAEQLGDFSRAIEEYRYSIRIAPGSTDARVRCARLLMASGRYREAIQVLQSGAGEAPLDLEAELVAMHLSGYFGDPQQIAQTLAVIRARWPGASGRALAEAAEGLAETSGPAVALEMLVKAPQTDYSKDVHAPALLEIVELAHRTGREDLVASDLEAIFEARTESAVIQAVRGRWLELSGADPAEVRAAYTRALALDPNDAIALSGLARLALAEQNLGVALEMFDRASRADPSDAAPGRSAALALIEASRPDEAHARLERVLRDHPLDAESALALVRLDLQRDAVDARTADWARRATRFGRNRPESWELRARVHEALGEADLANEAAGRAKQLRESAEAAS